MEKGNRHTRRLRSKVEKESSWRAEIRCPEVNHTQLVVVWWVTRLVILKISSHLTLVFLSLWGKYVVISGLDIPSAKECDNDMTNSVVKANKNNDQTEEESHLMFFEVNVSDEARERERKRQTSQQRTEKKTKGTCKSIWRFSLSLSSSSNTIDDNDLYHESSNTISINKARQTSIIFLIELILAQWDRSMTVSMHAHIRTNTFGPNSSTVQ